MLRVTAAAVLGTLLLTGPATHGEADDPERPDTDDRAHAHGGGVGPFSSNVDHGDHFPNDWVTLFQDAMRRGDIPVRQRGDIPLAPPRPRTLGTPGCVTAGQIFPYEDSESLLLTNFSTSELLNLMYDAGEELIDTHGDNFDFIAFWVNFTPHHTVGTAFYSGIFNDVSGIGLSQFDNRGFSIRNSSVVQGVVMMWDVNSGFWAPGDGEDADFTRLVLGQEFEHRWAMFLPALLDGRRLQGDDVCGRSSHWSFHVDGQGSSMELIEWVGSDPAILELTDTLPLTFNTDIPGGVWSYTDLYLMGYVSPAEMDAGNSELRFMDDWTCMALEYTGPISHFSSADIIASAGPRIPSATGGGAPKHFRTGWVMLHLPDAPPTPDELEKAAGILSQHTLDWDVSTGGRGTIDNTIFDDCNCNGAPDAEDIESGVSEDTNGNGLPDECEPDCNDNGRFDYCDITEGYSQDCNRNAIPDECDLVAGVSGDCNGNDVPDECEVFVLATSSSGELSPIGSGASQVFTIDDPPAAVREVELLLTASADLDAGDEWINIFLNGVSMGRVFVTTGTNCANPPDADALLVPAFLYNQAIEGESRGLFKLTTPATVNGSACGGASFVTLTVSVPVPGPNDVNANDVPDECECLGDLDGSGVTDFDDVLSLFSAWGPCEACPEDIDRSGEVDFADMIIVLSSWGPCPE